MARFTLFTGTQPMRDWGRSHPLEVAWIKRGVLMGALLGFVIGGVGIAGRGGAVGFSGLAVALVLACVGALAGSRFGAFLDKRTATREALGPL